MSGNALLSILLVILMLALVFHMMRIDTADLTPVIIRLDSVLDRIERLEIEQQEKPVYRGQYGGARWSDHDD